MNSAHGSEGSPAASLEDLDFARMLAGIAERIALAHFRSPDLVVERRPDGSVTTSANQAIEKTLLRLIADWHPADGILGEELGLCRPGRSRCWVIDPIHMTVDYAAGGTDWGILIALEVDGELQVGVVAAPLQSATWWAGRGLGAFRNGELITVSHASPAVTVAGDLARRAAGGHLPDPLAAVVTASTAVEDGGVAWPELAVAEGRVDIAVTEQAHRWCLGARQVIVEEAGGSFTNLRGERRTDSGSAVAASSDLLLQRLFGSGDRVGCGA